MFQANIFFALIAMLFSFRMADAASDLPAVEVIGNKFFYADNGTQFLIRGIAYQQNTANSTDTSFTDPLADGDSCKRDVEYFKKLNTNVLRVYAVNASLDHDDCMNTFAEAGIYIIADLAEPDSSITSDSPEWNIDLYERYTDVVDMFSNYSNVLGFFAGNEVTTNSTNSDSAAFVKAAIRDTKKYISDKNYRSIPVGYSSNDDSDTRIAIADYFACGDTDERADFFGINMYEWCGDSTFESSGYESRTEEFKNLTIPVFLSEYGCNTVHPRKFTEVQAIFGDNMTDVWSGGIVYMYFQEENNYGLVSIDGSSVSTLSDFNYYSSQINNISPSLAKASSGSSTVTMSCPVTASTWSAVASLPPTPDSGLCDCMSSSLSCVVSSDVDESDYGDLFGYACDGSDCDDINSNSTSGVYGSYSFCSSKEKLSYVLNKYYESNGSKSSACDFSGSASINSKATTASTCSAKLSSASASGGSSGAGSSGSSGGSSGSGSSSSSTSSGSSSSKPKSSGANSLGSFSNGQLITATTFVVCFVSGFSIVLFN